MRDKYYNSFPEWYWKHGLHDAEILSTDITISEFNDYLSKNKLWWLSDIVEKTEYGYKLDICFIGKDGREKNISMRLSSATITRKI